MTVDDEHKNTEDIPSAEERSAKRKSPFVKMTDFGAASAAESDADIEQDGMPSVGRRRGNNKLINVLGIIVILIAGVALIVAVNGDKNKTLKKKKEAQEVVANNLPPLMIPAPPDRLNLTPASGAPTTSVTVNGASGTKPIALTPGKANANGAAVKPVTTWQERKMHGLTLVATSTGASGMSNGIVPLQPQPPAVDDGSQGSNGFGGTIGTGTGSGSGRGELSAKLEPTVMKGAMAGVLPDRNFIIAKGTSLDCALETALDSTVPGLTTCRVTRDVYSDNGQVVLLDRGTQLVGEYQGGIKLGQARMFVLWSRAKTPTGVIVNLNSPGTDALGRSGLEGWVDTHFIERFGAALMISLLKDSYAYLIARQSQGGGQNTLVLGNTAQGTDKLAEKALDASVNIPPTMIKNQGDHIQVMLARDLDFANVYALRAGR